LSVTIQVKDPGKLEEYISQAPATMAPHGAEMLGRGQAGQVLNGFGRGHNTVKGYLARIEVPAGWRRSIPSVY